MFVFRKHQRGISPMKTLRNLVLTPSEHIMYRLYLEDITGKLIHCADGELAVLIREYNATYHLPGYQKVWWRVKQDGGAYADFVHDRLHGNLYLFKIIKLSLLVPIPANTSS